MRKHTTILAAVLVFVFLLLVLMQGRKLLVQPWQNREKKATEQQTELAKQWKELQARQAQANAAVEALKHLQGRLLGDDFSYQLGQLLNSAQAATGATWTLGGVGVSGLGGSLYQISGTVKVQGSMQQAQAFIAYLERSKILVHINDPVLTQTGGSFGLTCFAQVQGQIPGATPPKPAATPQKPATPSTTKP